MNEIQIFNNPEFGEVRTLEENGAVLFCGTDIARALGYSNPRDAISRHCKRVVKRDGVSQTTNQHGTTSEQRSEMSFITESDLYRLIFGSKLPAAEQFTDWVTNEILPNVRRHGAYMKPETLEAAIYDPDYLLRVITVLKEETDRRKALEAANASLSAENEIMAPKAEYFDQLCERNTLTNFRETAKELGIQPKKFVQYLIDKKYVYRDQRRKLMPYEQQNNGLFVVKEAVNENNAWSGTQTLVTPKGRETFRLLCRDI